MTETAEKTTKTLPENLHFKGKWRSYQQNFLDEITIHLADKKLNVVAAPGAGKTTLGIEIVRRLNRPALILAPTITIKNQWKQRIIDGFLEENEDNSWISTSIKNISTVTSTTYQSVHTVIKDSVLQEKFFEELKKHGVKTLVLDEAHHLRTEWYHSLEYLCDKLAAQDFRIISLTATPPYDVSVSEWNNYHSLCGSVDAEISIPELVQNGDLCPHQDLIWFSNLSEDEKKIVFDFKKNRDNFFKYLNKESDFSYAIKTSVFVDDYENNVEIIYDNTDFTIAIISYLLSIDDMSVEAAVLAEFLCLTKAQIPVFDYEIAQTLFNGILGKYHKYFKNVPLLKSKLKEYKLLKTSTTVDFTGEEDLKKIYARSLNKLNAIKEITILESQLLNEQLREVVLLDYIGAKKSIGLNVLSVFDNLCELKNNKVAILTGSLIVVPDIAKEQLYELLKKHNIDRKNVLLTEYNSGYLRVETYGNVNLVGVITELFSGGAFNILIGTQALLGEGWDAPCVNALIIASTVGSFMLSNQIRGRALRINKNSPQKTADIWHLVSLSNGEESFDLNIVKKRFDTFEGVSFIDDKIQNGLERLGYDWAWIIDSKCQKLNEYSKYLAAQRKSLSKKWQQVFVESSVLEEKIRPRVYETIQIKGIKLPNICFAGYENRLYKFIRNIIGKTVIKYSGNDVFLIADAILKTMCETNIILTPYQDIKLINKMSFNNQKKLCEIYLTLLNCTNYERNLFVKTLNEFFEPPKNNRYILRKEDTETRTFRYLSVPDIIGSKKNKVKILERNLEPVLGYIDIIFTKNPEGRRELLKAKFNLLELQKISKCKIWI